MKADAVLAVSELAKQADRKEVLTVPSEPSDVYFLLDADANYVRRVAEPPPEKHKPASLDAVADLAAKYGVGSQVFFSRAAVTLVYKDAERRSRATLPLALSPQLLKLAEWERSKAGMTQAALIAAFKQTFPDNIEGVGVVEMIRRIKITVSTAAEQTKTARSIGKAAEAQFGDNNEIPDNIRFKVPVFANGALSAIVAVVQCAFDMDPSSGAATFQIVPCAGQIEAAITLGEQTIGARLGELLAARGVKPESCIVVYGAEQ